MEQTFTKVIDLLYLAKQQEVEIVLNDGRLQMKVAEDKDVSENLLNQIKINRQSIIDFLSSDSWKLNKADENPVIHIQPEARPERIPLSYSQERLWFIDQIEGSVQYHITAVLRLQGNLNEEALANAFTELVNRHQILRTVYVEQGGQAWQYIKPAGSAILKRTEKWQDSRENLKKYIATTAGTSFDLSKDDMLRAELIPISDDEHVLLVTMHHIASDAWSMPVLVKEVAELYDSYSKGRAPQLPAINVQYADYALWQRSARQDALLLNKLAYWKQKLDGVLPLELPADFNRPLVSSNRGAAAAMPFSPALHARLQLFCQRQGATLYMVLLAVFKVLLHRYSGQQDICVGTSIAGRPQKELEGLIGFFVNTLALRSDVDGNMSFTELLSQVRSTMIEAYNHQQVPFEKVVEAVVKDRDPGRNPLFQVMLVLRNTPEVPELRLGDLRLSGEPNEQTTVKFDLTFFVTETAGGLNGSVQYSTDLYKPRRIESMIAHFMQLLVSVIEQPNQTVGLMPMLGVQEQNILLQQFNDSHIAYPTDKTIVDLFEEQVAENPGATALVFEDEVLTYTQLNERSNQLAHYLISCGVQPDTLVPLFMERSAGMMVAMLGIMKAGAAYVPIDADFPVDRVNYMLQDAGAGLVISSPVVSEKLELQAAIKIITLEDVVISSHPKENPVVKLLPHHLAYVIYTSGSTGRPKGVMIEHRHLVDYYYGLKKYIQINECRSFALVSTIATDLGNTVIYGSLLSGGELHIFSRESVNNIEYLHHYFNEKSIECIKIVPSHWKALRNEDALLLPKKLLVFGGETLQADVVEQIQLSGTACRIVNHYGPTETTIGKLLHQVQPGKKYHQTIPIGKPFSNTRIYVVSTEMQLCPVGIPGQLFISGDGVARGYYRNEKLTSERFIADPFREGEQGHAMMYATGDLVQWLEDGNITFIGRVDDQVKIRGYRVEPGEVERVLQQTAGVSAAVVLAQQDKQANNRLIAYIIPQGPFDREGITAHLKEKLPEYMLPAVLMEIEKIPLTANGKIDRKALPDPDETGTVNERFVAPRNDIEIKMAAIWADVLEEDQIGIYNDFFELGGHSLLAVRLVSAIRKAFEVEIPIGHIFDYPTIAQLSTQLAAQANAVVLPVIKAVHPRLAEIPLSFSQERLWFIHQMEGSVQYHVPAVLRLTGKVNEEALQFALQSIVARHEVLRTVYRQVDGKPYQVVQDAAGWQLHVIDGTHFKDDPKALQQQVAQLITAPYHLSEDYILRVSLIHLHDEEQVLVITLHHIASDGWSKSILVNDFAAFYLAFEQGKPAQLPQLPVQYADYAIWQRHHLEGAILETKIDYWKQQLQGVPALQLPTDFVRPAIQSSRGAFTSFSIGKELLTQLHGLSQQHNATLFMTLLAAFEVLLYRYSGQSDFSVGTPVAGRNQQETEGLIGFFVNTLALRANVNAGFTFEELLQNVRQDTLAAFEHQEAPFEKVVEAVVKNRDLSRSPLFQVMFVLRNQPEIPRLAMKDIAISGAGYQHTTSLFDMTMFVTEYEHGLEGSLEYNTDLFNAATIRRMLSHFTQLLASVVAAPKHSISHLPMLSPAEEQQLLYEFNPAGQDAIVDKSMVALFEEQVQQSPQAIALCFDEEQLTYEALNAKANQLAAYLRTKGVAAGALVPVCVSRSMDMIVSVLAILKTGAAYVPVDPNYPLQRINYMLQDTQASVLISTSEHIDKLSPAANAVIVNLTTDAAVIASQSAANLPLHRDAEGLAYVLYTSGSTGRPKGVCMPDRALTNLLLWQKRQFAIAERRVLQFASLNFDVSFQEIFSTLCFGSRLYLIDTDRRKDMGALVEYVTQNRINHLFLPYIVLKSLAEYLVPHVKDEFVVKEIIVAGEQLNITQEINAFISQYKIKLVNQYGPTEAHVVSSFTIEPDTNVPALPPVGKPVDNTSLYIIDSNQQLVPVGVAGELCIGGQQVAQGYLNLPELTAERFITDPFSIQPSKLMYKTGDLARWLPDGNIAYLGRADEQVKVRGYRIELGEVEAALQQSGLVTAATVIVRKNNDTGSNLVAYVIPKEIFDKEALVTHLKNVLPDYMVPALWVQMEVFPLTGSGKIDKQALPEADGNEATPKYAAPRTRLENELVIIWKELLHLQQVGIHDNFFELGGHSLLAMRLVAAIRKRLDSEVSIRSLFQYNTIADLANHIEATGRQSLLPATEALPRPAFIPLSFSQERLWFIDRLQGSVQYHIPAVLRLTGPVDTSALSAVLRHIIQRHEVLRTVLLEEEGAGYQQVNTADGWQMQMEDGEEYTTHPEHLGSYIRKIIGAPFDLSADYMLRATLLSLGREEHLLIATVHHIASDGWSISILVRELAHLYNNTINGQPGSLLPLPVQYADYAIWQRKHLQGEAWNKKLAYWKYQLADTAPLQLPTDYSRPPVQGTNGAITGVEIDEQLCDRLQEFSQQQGVTLFMTLLATFNVLLYRYSGQADICVGTPIAGRQQQELEGLIGFFVNTLALRSNVIGGTSFTNLLQQVKETTLQAYEHQEVPFEKVVEAVVKERDMSLNPLFQVMLMLQNTPEVQQLQLNGLQVSRGIAGLSTSISAKFDLLFSVTETRQGLAISAEYATDLYGEQTVKKMLAHFAQLLHSVVQNPANSIDLLPMLSSTEQSQLLTAFNDTVQDRAIDATVIDLFETQVQKSPKAIAVVFEGGQLTYAELDRKSNQLANLLLEKGVKRGALVPLCIHRSMEMIIGVLAILKTGAAYVPVDAEYPEERIRYMLEDTGAALIISSDNSVSRLARLKNWQVIDPVADEQIVSSQSGTNLKVARHADDIVYVLYTSGSTGRPKGVRMPGKALVNLLTWQQKQFTNKYRRVLQFASLNFDVSFQEIFSTLCFGSRLSLIGSERRKDIVALLEDVYEQQITHLFIPYVVLKNVAEYLVTVSNKGFALEEIMVAGEQLKITDDVRTIIKNFNIKLVNQYGPTEAHVVSSYTIEPGTVAIGLPPIGKPIDNTFLYILSPQQQLVPVNVAGELYIGGVQVASGYLNLPELTAQKFIDNPFSDEADSRLYKTGDLARWLPDGNIEYLGRIDDQVKIRGYRVEPGEIESVLQQSGLVSQVTVLAKDDNSGNKNLVAYVVPTGAFNQQELISYMQARLPNYMLPQAWVQMDHLPLNSNGKVDRNALPEPETFRLPAKQYKAPRNELETNIAEIWQELLGVQQVGINDNFFELGGHSLFAIRVVWQIKKRMNLDIRVNDIFIYPTIAGLAGNMIDKVKNPSLPDINIRYLVPIKTAGTKLPLYIVAGGGGTALKIKSFAGLLHPEQPVYVFQPPFGMEDLKGFPDTVEGIATIFLGELLVQNPAGPYALSGHCLGGIIAFEMARQLKALGKKVHSLSMFDTVIRKKVAKEPGTLKNLYHIPYVIHRSFSRLMLKVDFQTFLLRKHPMQSIRYKVDKLQLRRNRHKKLQPGVNTMEYAGLEIFNESSDVYMAACRNYQLVPYDDNILLFYASEHYFFLDSVRNISYKKIHLDDRIKNNWREYAADITIFDIKGEHADIFNPKHGEDFARLLQKQLDNLSLNV